MTGAIPPHLMPLVHEHLIEHVGRGRDALLFPSAAGGGRSPVGLYEVDHPAREAAGRPDLRFHDLRHTGATLAAATGATLAKLMRRLGHSTPGAAMLYQHAADDRDAAIAGPVRVPHRQGRHAAAEAQRAQGGLARRGRVPRGSGGAAAGGGSRAAARALASAPDAQRCLDRRRLGV